MTILIDLRFSNLYDTMYLIPVWGKTSYFWVLSWLFFTIRIFNGDLKSYDQFIYQNEQSRLKSEAEWQLVAKGTSLE